MSKPHLNLEKEVKTAMESCYGSQHPLGVYVKGHAASSLQGCFTDHSEKLCRI